MKYQQIEDQINEIKAIDQEAGEEFEKQVSFAETAKWTKADLLELLLSEDDIADQYFEIDSEEHFKARDLQHFIAEFYGEEEP